MIVSQYMLESKSAIHKKGSGVMEYQMLVSESATQSTTHDQSDQTASEPNPAIIMAPETSVSNWFAGADEELMRRLRG